MYIDNFSNNKTIPNMKFTLFVLIIGSSCFLATSLNDNLYPSSLSSEPDHNYIASGISETVDVERFSISWSALNNIIRTIVSNRKGIICSIKEIFKVDIAAFKFIIDIRKCSDSAVRKLNETVNRIISNANDILEINEKLQIDDPDNNRENDGKIPPKVYSELCSKQIALKDKIYEGLNIIETAVGTVTCGAKAINELGKVLAKFPTDMMKCMKQ